MAGYFVRAFAAQQRRSWESAWNDHAWLRDHQYDPILGGLYKRRYQELYDAEVARKRNDFKKHTGTKGSQYWIDDYQPNSGYYSPSGYLFEVSEAIMSLYSMSRRV